MTTNQEEWRDIPDYEGRYQASTYGNIRSIDRVVIVQKDGKEFARTAKSKLLKPGKQDKVGHSTVCLGKGNSKLVHRLVISTFARQPICCEDVRHLDGNPKNNRLDNLMIGSRKENILDVYSIGKAWKKLTVDQVYAIRERITNGDKGRDIAKDFGIKEACVSAIKTRRLYGWLQ